jgi:hypothetical protein
VEREQIGVQVEDTIAEISGDFFDLFEEFKKLRFAVEVGAVSGAVLCDEDNFLGSLLDKVANFGENGRKRERNLLSSDFRNDTEGAGIIAALSDFEIFKFVVDVGQGTRN